MRMRLTFNHLYIVNILSDRDDFRPYMHFGRLGDIKRGHHRCWWNSRRDGPIIDNRYIGASIVAVSTISFRTSIFSRPHHKHTDVINDTLRTTTRGGIPRVTNFWSYLSTASTRYVDNTGIANFDVSQNNYVIIVCFKTSKYMRKFGKLYKKIT